MDEERIKEAVLAVIERTDFAGKVASALATAAPAAAAPPQTPGTKRLLERIVLSDILDDAILGARPGDRTFPLRLFFGELGTLLASDADHHADSAFTLASGLSFFFRAAMDPESKIRVGLEVSRALYTLSHDAQLDAEMVGKAAPLLAALMSTELERAKFESVDHSKIFDSQLHERAEGSDGSSARIVRPASFLCRVSTNNAVKAKAQVVT